MHVLNQRLLKTCPSDDYFALPGVSHSSLKGEGREQLVPTAKMQLGTLVHTYLLTPAEYNYEQFAVVRPLAVALKQRLGPLLALSLPEAVVLADFVHEGFCLPFKGRIDLCVPGRLVVDIKVSEMAPAAFLERFKTCNQLTGYALGVGASLAVTVFINPKTKITNIINVPLTPEWWEHHIKRKGEPVL